MLRVGLAAALSIALFAYGGISFARVYGLGRAMTAIAYPGMLVIGAAGATMIFNVRSEANGSSTSRPFSVLVKRRPPSFPP